MSPEVKTRRMQEGRSRNRSGAAAGDHSEAVTTSLRLHAICVTLCLLAAFIFTLTEHDDHRHTFWCIFEIAMQTLLVVVATVYFRARLRLLHQSSVITPMLVMVACLSLICEPIQRLFFNTGHAFEMLVMHSQCNLMLALGVCGFRMSFQRLAVIIAVFMTIFCCTISSARGLFPLTVLFSAMGIVWLVASWWETVDRRLLDTERGGLPKLWLTAAVSLPVLALLSAGAFGSNTVTTALRGFMPSSGGTGQYSPYSRGGVNDGDALVAGNENIKSFAALEDAPFLDSDKPSLYDVFNDTYDEPAKRIKNQQRAIALSADLMKHIHQIMAEAKQAGREFSLLRSEKRGDKGRIRDLDTHALFYVAGRTPAHFKTEVYEYFDGITWAPSAGESIDHLSLRETDGRHWLNIPQRGHAFDIFYGTATHSLKIANLEGNVVPSPAHPVGVSIDLVDRADMYSVSDRGLVSLNRDSVPSMTPINFVSRCLSRSQLSASTRVSIVRRSHVRTVKDLAFHVPEGRELEEVARLAERITAGLPRGWQQVETIENHLRENYELDRSRLVKETSDSPLTDFLFESRRGPEYLFASSAAMMLRTLGYQTRFVSGFYARPERYDEHKRHTAVMAADAHFWCEVCIGAGTWITVEATPGYSLLQPPPGLLTRLWDAIKTAGQFVLQNAVRLTLALFAVSVLFVCRRSLQERLLTLRWRLISRTAAKTRAVQLGTLIDHRLRLAGLERQAGTTLKRWASQSSLRPVHQELKRVADIANQAMYSPHTGMTFDDGELERLASQLSFRHLRQLRKQSTQMAGSSQSA